MTAILVLINIGITLLGYSVLYQEIIKLGNILEDKNKELESKTNLIGGMVLGIHEKLMPGVIEGSSPEEIGH